MLQPQQIMGILCFLTTFAIGLSQTPLTPDTSHIRHVLDEASMLKFQDSFRAEELVKSALTLAEEAESLELQARGWYELAHIHWDRGLYLESLHCDSIALKINELLDDSLSIANTRMGMGVTLFDLKRNDLALNHYLAAHEIYDDLGMMDRQYFILLNMALIFNEIKDFDRSGDLLFEALNIAELMEDASSPSHVLHDLGVYYTEQGRHLESLDCYNEALDLYEESGEPTSVAFVLNNRGVAYTRLGEFVLARQDILGALQLSQDFNDYSMQSFALANLGGLEVSEGRFDAAASVLDSALSFAKRMNFVEDQVEIYDHLANLYLNTKDMAKAYEAREHYHQLYDSLSAYTSKSAIEATLRAYDAKRAAQGVVDIERDFETLVLRNRITLAFGIAFLMVLLIFGIITNRNAKTIRKQNSMLTRVNAELEYRSSMADKALKAKEEFLSMMSHELRTPLTSVIGIAELLSMRDRQSEEHQDLELLKFSANNLHLLINNILDFNKIEAGKISLEKVPFDLRDLFTSIWKSHKTTCTNPKIAFALNIEESFPISIVSDPVRLTQILNNLLGNAVKFTPEGRVSLEVFFLENTNSLKIIVADSGIGIAEDQIDKVFEVFNQAEASTTRKYGGTGLGLAIVDRLVKLMHGEITLASEKHVGTCFTVLIPVEVDHSRNHESSTRTSISTLKRVLLVDDNELNLRVTKHILLESGVHSADVAMSGEEAITLCETNDYDVIVMDIEMPHMDGYDAAEKIRQLNKDVRIIAFSANTVREVLEHNKAENFNAVLSKPASSADLVRALSES